MAMCQRAFETSLSFGNVYFGIIAVAKARTFLQK